ncbi:DUF7576 family protein [Halosimplex amylolyticum]|uniref:DUF7576 family protein n=1 Tax=Halosimplex amylolyticum TaxID=3396616 RepID=UPI003F56619C
MSEAGSSFPERCAHCGAPFEEGTRYPTTTDGEAGDLRVLTFCSEVCAGEYHDGAGDERT